MRYETPAPPAELGEADGLAYSLWLPEGDPWAGVVILHGAGSCKESHHDFARAARSAGLSAVCFDQRGHGASAGALDGRALEDVATVAALLGDVPLALRGSSMGGYLAILAAERLRRARGGGDLPGERRRAVARACAAASSSSAPTSPRSRRSWPSTRWTPRRAPRRCRCCSCTPRATSASRSRTRASWRGARRTRAPSSWSSPAATTARSSTTPSCRVTPCAGCGASSAETAATPARTRGGAGGGGAERRVLEDGEACAPWGDARARRGPREPRAASPRRRAVDPRTRPARRGTRGRTARARRACRPSPSRRAVRVRSFMPGGNALCAGNQRSD